MSKLFSQRLAEIVSISLAQNELHGIVEILKKLAESVDACGCILWEIDPWADVQSNPPTGKLNVFARWFCPGIEPPLRELHIHNSANGRAIVSEEILSITDMKTDNRTYKDVYSIETAHLTSMCVVPIKFDAEHYNASLSVYRQGEIKPFTEDEQSFIKQIGDLISSLYQAVREKVRHLLLSDTTRILYEAEQRAKANNDSMDVIIEGFKTVCTKVADAFQCIETSLFLKNRFESENQFNLIATTYTDWTDERTIYFPDKKLGLTGWALEYRRRIAIFNLSCFVEDKEKLQKEYNEVQWNDSLDIQSIVKKHFYAPDGHPPPLSFMAVPIIRDEHLLGVIRCCTATKDPWYFAHRQMELLESVATQLHRFWKDWLQYLEEKEDNNMWAAFVEKIRELNDEVKEGFHQAALNEDILFDRILSLAKASITNSDILAVRLYDKKTEELYFAKIIGSTDTPEINAEIEEYRAKRFPIDKTKYANPPLSVLIFEDGKARSIINAEIQRYQPNTFPRTKRILGAPISLQKGLVGVLDIRGISEKPFPAYALRMAQLLGQQLGLYLSLWQSEKQQRQVFEDLWHQLKGSVRHTFTRANGLIHIVRYKQWQPDDYENADDVLTQLIALRGVARKSKRTAINAGVFKELAREGRLEIEQSRMKRLQSNVAYKILYDAGEDTRSAIEEYREITVSVDKSSLAGLESVVVKADLDFFEQAVNCLLDNAGKYSFPETTIKITGGEMMKRGQSFFYILFTNQGLCIRAEEISKITERYYRGLEAKASTGEGSGIGLWVVDHIMKGHGGELEVIPTNKKGTTEVRLLFPIQALAR
jgi:signal transduction histidine kinase